MDQCCESLREEESRKPLAGEPVKELVAVPALVVRAVVGGEEHNGLLVDAQRFQQLEQAADIAIHACEQNRSLCRPPRESRKRARVICAAKSFSTFGQGLSA